MSEALPPYLVILDWKSSLAITMLTLIYHELSKTVTLINVI